MASLGIPGGAVAARHLADARPADPFSARLTRYADVAAVAGVGVAVFAALFVMLEYQLTVVKEVVKGEVAPLAAAMVEMDKRMSTQLVELDKRLTVRIDGLDRRMDRLGQRMDRIEQRMDRIELRIDGLDQRVGELGKQVTGLGNRIGRLEGKVGM